MSTTTPHGHFPCPCPTHTTELTLATTTHGAPIPQVLPMLRQGNAGVLLGSQHHVSVTTAAGATRHNHINQFHTDGQDSRQVEGRCVRACVRVFVCVCLCVHTLYPQPSSVRFVVQQCNPLHFATQEVCHTGRCGVVREPTQLYAGTWKVHRLLSCWTTLWNGTERNPYPAAPTHQPPPQPVPSTKLVSCLSPAPAPAPAPAPVAAVGARPSSSPSATRGAVLVEVSPAAAPPSFVWS